MSRKSLTEQIKESKEYAIEHHTAKISTIAESLYNREIGYVEADDLFHEATLRFTEALKLIHTYELLNRGRID